MSRRKNNRGSDEDVDDDPRIRNKVRESHVRTVDPPARRATKRIDDRDGDDLQNPDAEEHGVGEREPPSDRTIPKGVRLEKTLKRAKKRQFFVK